MRLAVRVHGRSHRFGSVRDVLARANEPKAGDERAGIAARSHEERAAAKLVLAELTLGDLRAHPVAPLDEDEVSRVIDAGVDEAVHREIRGWSVGELRDWLLADDTTTDAMRRVSRGLTAEMAAGVAKLCSNLDLIYAARRLPFVTRARTTVGLPGRLSTRLQPNHPSDDPDGITASIYEGLAYGAGDALIGINPCIDDVPNVTRLLELTRDVIARLGVPTQNCVLAHVATQMRALERGAPMDIIFQSLAGTEAAVASFGTSVAMLDEARAMIRERSTLRARDGRVSPTQLMYFETGQGSELSAGAHGGADQVTLEARCYGLARRYDPFLVNTVVGFIGPEYLADGRQIVRAGLEDHFMGKLLGVPLGADACYTNHAEADQNDCDTLATLLATAGCNYFMGVPAGDDVMLSYQCTSFHDGATLRQLLGLRPAPEFEAWLVARGLMADGRLTGRAGDPAVFLA
ncbi:MAG: ethanolamine ammonia-lyase subunit EutB [Deltaproteobacteria bacterium]|nr:ethanolamine ammonia-lyase subunit EutB [Deltaproteobacteria bacterium]